MSMEAAGIEPASNKDRIKVSTDIVCFVYKRWVKNKQKNRRRPFGIFIPGRQKESLSDPILLDVAPNFPQEKKLGTAALITRQVVTVYLQFLFLSSLLRGSPQSATLTVSILSNPIRPRT